MPELNSQNHKLAEHYFRHEYAKMVAVITRYFGLARLNLAEDIVQDTLLEAIKTWEYKGIPENPTGWLYTVAKNKALNAIKRMTYQQNYEKDEHDFHAGQPLENPIEAVFTREKIADDQLRMMFACCHPSISRDAQITLMLKTLCGLNITEIASAYLTSEETINKRLVRARKTLRRENVDLEIPATAEIAARLETVIKSIYLMFNEGYAASTGDKVIRFDLCMEAIRLARLLDGNHLFADNATVKALLALMLLNAARFDARIDEEGMIVDMEKQDRGSWRQPLIEQGIAYLENIEMQNALSVYHFMAAISAVHCVAVHFRETDWHKILALYDGMLLIDQSPVVRLNRAIAFAHVNGYPAAIVEAEALRNKGLKNYHYFHSTLAEFYLKAKRYRAATLSLEAAISLCPNDVERRLLNKRLKECQKYYQ